METFKPRTSAWMILAIICAPLAAVGALDLFLNPDQWPYATAVISGAIILVGYNFTVRLFIDDDFVTFKRYGVVVWRTPRRGAQIEDGLAGDIPFLPALIIRHGAKKVGFIAKGWFEEPALSALRQALIP
jgi:hypothetical protein